MVRNQEFVLYGALLLINAGFHHPSFPTIPEDHGWQEQGAAMEPMVVVFFVEDSQTLLQIL